MSTGDTGEMSFKPMAQEILDLREQVAILTKERDIKEHCIVQLEAEDLRMKRQIAVLAAELEK